MTIFGRRSKILTLAIQHIIEIPHDHGVQISMKSEAACLLSSSQPKTHDLANQIPAIECSLQRRAVSTDFYKKAIRSNKTDYPERVRLSRISYSYWSTTVRDPSRAGSTGGCSERKKASYLTFELI